MPVPENAPKAAPSTDGPFEVTRWSVVLAAGGADPAARSALELVGPSYWYPLYAFVRREGTSPHDAQDLTRGTRHFDAGDRPAGTLVTLWIWQTGNSRTQQQTMGRNG